MDDPTWRQFLKAETHCTCSRQLSSLVVSGVLLATRADIIVNTSPADIQDGQEHKSLLLDKEDTCGIPS